MTDIAPNRCNHRLINAAPSDRKEQLAANKNSAELIGKTRVTRSGVHVDRIACAWLIRRFIDPEARFKFVSVKNYDAGPGELCFDMFKADFTHVGDMCSFKVLLQRIGLDDRALRATAEIVHNIDLKDGKFGRSPSLRQLTISSSSASEPTEPGRRLPPSAKQYLSSA